MPASVSRQSQAAAFVEPSPVTGVQPSVLQGSRSRRVVEVAIGEVVATDQDLVIVGDPDQHAGQRRTTQPRVMIVTRRRVGRRSTHTPIPRPRPVRRRAAADPEHPRRPACSRRRSARSSPATGSAPRSRPTTGRRSTDRPRPAVTGGSEHHSRCPGPRPDSSAHARQVRASASWVNTARAEPAPSTAAITAGSRSRVPSRRICSSGSPSRSSVAPAPARARSPATAPAPGRSPCR